MDWSRITWLHDGHEKNTNSLIAESNFIITKWTKCYLAY